MSRDLSELLGVSTMTLATSGAGGEPHAASVYFAAGENLRLFFFSDPKSQHVQDIDLSSRAAVAIYPECHDWRDIHGLQMRGSVYAVTEKAEWESGWKLYVTKFPFVANLKAIVRQNNLYVFIPGWVRLVDNRRSFGHKEEWRLP